MRGKMREESNGRYKQNQRARQQTGKKRRISKKRRSVLRFNLVVLGVFAFFFFSLGKRTGMELAAEKLEERAASMLTEEGEESRVKKVTRSGGGDELILVNKTYSLPQDYATELVTLPDKVNRAAREAYEPLCKMLEAGRREGLQFEICSSYRDVSMQERLFKEDVELLMERGYTYEEAYDEVEKETMPPGHSEHSTGLAFDIVALDYQMLDAGQERTEENIWLQENCAEYGFILRYPKGKEQITGISYESWHFRYVGEKAAKYIMQNGITLEEYLGKEI